jgi:Protein of unknown function (DUF3016)
MKSSLTTRTRIRGVLPCLAAVAVALGFLAPLSARGDAPKPGDRVLVTFDHPEKFLDVRDSNVPTAEGRDKILASLRDYITQRAPAFLPKGDALYVTFINIKLAGVFAIGEVPPHGRFIAAGTPPLFMFGWAITDPSGKVVGRAWEKLEEQDFMNLFQNADPSDPLRFEKAVLDDWMRNRLQS